MYTFKIYILLKFNPFNISLHIFIIFPQILFYGNIFILSMFNIFTNIIFEYIIIFFLIRYFLSSSKSIFWLLFPSSNIWTFLLKGITTIHKIVINPKKFNLLVVQNKGLFGYLIDNRQWFLIYLFPLPRIKVISFNILLSSSIY